MKEKIIIVVVAIILVLGSTWYFKGMPTYTSNEGLPGLAIPRYDENTQNTKESTTSQKTNTVKGIVTTMSTVNFQNYLVDRKGITLYMSTKDGKLISNCKGSCIKKWLPYYYYKDLKSASDPLSKKLNLFKRDTGEYQYAYGLIPLYYYVGDEKTGDVNGHGLDGGTWNVITVK